MSRYALISIAEVAAAKARRMLRYCILERGDDLAFEYEDESARELIEYRKLPGERLRLYTCVI